MYIYIRPFIYLSIYPCIYPHKSHLSMYLSIYSLIDLPTYLFISPSICSLVHLSIKHPFNQVDSLNKKDKEISKLQESLHFHSEDSKELQHFVNIALNEKFSNKLNQELINTQRKETQQKRT